MSGSSAYDGSETTGFMSPARDHAASGIDLAETLDLRRPSRYLVRVRGTSFESRGILDGDVLVVDAARKAVAGSVVVAITGEEVTVAVVEMRGGRLRLRRPDRYLDQEETEVWAVAVALVREGL